MKPNFALSLSQEGIRLLHRAADGWTVVGEADFLNDDLAEQLAVMRRTASMLAPSGVRCKLVLPNDQIRYLTVPYSTDDEQSRSATAKEALEGATPYDVNELAFALSDCEDALQIAAVARETLAEAEAFAVEHRFHPVSFVADPDPADFFGEPFFGQTGEAKELLPPGEEVEPDSIALSGFEKRVEGQDLQKDAGLQVQLEAAEFEDNPLERLADVPESAVQAQFVSRRKVPTFRTETPPETHPVSGLVNDDDHDRAFAEAPAEYVIPEHRKIHSPRPAQLRQSEEERLTVFGARDAATAVSRKNGLMRVAAVILLVALGIAAFASGMLNAGMTAVFERSKLTGPEIKFAAPLQPQAPSALYPASSEPPVITLAALDQTLTAEDAAVLDALAAADEPITAPEEPGPVPRDLQSFYAVTGIWPRAPEVPNPTALVDLDDFYIPGIDATNASFDAVALPQLTSFELDQPLLAPASPAPANTSFSLNAQGLVIATQQGALNPDGIMVFAGPPPVRQPDNQLRVETPGEDLAQRMALAAFRPVARPESLIENNERATLGGLTRSELGLMRPRLRPQSAQENAASNASLVSLDEDGTLLRPAPPEDGFAGATARAVAASLRPDARPNDFSKIVARVQRQNKQTPSTAASTVRVAPRSVVPSIPSSASTARQATQKRAINLRKVNLIGVYGSPSSRRALVRLGNGRYRKVEVGDRIDGGRVSAIGDSELRYQKSGRAIVLKMPQG